MAYAAYDMRETQILVHFRDILYSLIFCRKRKLWIINNELSMSQNVHEKKN